MHHPPDAPQEPYGRVELCVEAACSRLEEDSYLSLTEEHITVLGALLVERDNARICTHYIEFQPVAGLKIRTKKEQWMWACWC